MKSTEEITKIIKHDILKNAFLHFGRYRFAQSTMANTAFINDLATGLRLIPHAPKYYCRGWKPWVILHDLYSLKPDQGSTTTGH